MSLPSSNLVNEQKEFNKVFLFWHWERCLAAQIYFFSHSVQRKWLCICLATAFFFSFLFFLEITVLLTLTFYNSAMVQSQQKIIVDHTLSVKCKHTLAAPVTLSVRNCLWHLTLLLDMTMLHRCYFPAFGSCLHQSTDRLSRPSGQLTGK